MSRHFTSMRFRDLLMLASTNSRVIFTGDGTHFVSLHSPRPTAHQQQRTLDVLQYRHGWDRCEHVGWMCTLGLWMPLPRLALFALC